MNYVWFLLLAAATLSSCQSSDVTSSGFTTRGGASECPAAFLPNQIRCFHCRTKNVLKHISLSSLRTTAAHHEKANDGDRHFPPSVASGELLHASSRRAVLGKTLTTAISVALTTAGTSIFPNSVALAVDSNNIKNPKPYAPLENLLPATRVQVLIHQAVETAQALVDEKQKGNTDGSSSTKQGELVATLRELLLQPRGFIQSSQEASASQTYLQIDTWSQWKRARQKEAAQQQVQLSKSISSNVDRNNPLTSANEAFEQWGERRQFERLQKQQRALEETNTMRSAFNAYTNNLVFGDSYTLTASRDEKSRMIRTYDQLPDVTSVVRSDLDLRDLYRNEVLTYMDDAKAELQYQLQQQERNESPVDGTEILALLLQAEKSCSEWFKFVPENDVKDALQVVLAEEQKVQS